MSMYKHLILSSFFLLLTSLLTVTNGHRNVDNEGLYKLLNVSQKASTKEIRISFKKIALVKHPDKNPDDPKANEEFVKINRAYEILKDEELRKKYDMYGEEGLKDNHNAGQQYQNWNFYHKNFGIYDDDPEVITLTRTDFVQMVETNSDIIWFVNFYSTQCSHCHELAPTWRELAKQLDGVIRIGAVNCGDDWMLCNEQQIRSFPSLIMYPKRTQFKVQKTLNNLLIWALNFAKPKVNSLNKKDYYMKHFNKQNESTNKKPWLISYCLSSNDDDDNINDVELNYELNCLEEIVNQKISITLDGLVNIGSIDCTKESSKEICSKLKPQRDNPILYYSQLPSLDENNDDLKVTPIQSSDYKEISKKILEDLPSESELSEEKFNDILANLKNPDKFEKTWLILFVDSGYKPGSNLDLKKLSVLFGPDYNFARVDCSKLANPQDCFTRFQVHKYPTFVLFKSASYQLSGPVKNMQEVWYEVYYNSHMNAADLTAFVKENAYTSVRSLNEKTFDEFLSQDGKEGVFIDFFAPWCPPCMNLLPEFRKSSKEDFNVKSIAFATVDCTINQNVCQRFQISNFPTTIFIYKSNQNKYFGRHSANDINEFIQDVINPTVITLTYELFHELVATKPVGKAWYIDYYASWCGPCQQMAPEWRKLGKRLRKDVASIGQVDCVVEQRLCAEQGITSYPNIRAYPATSYGTSQVFQYQNWMRDANNMLLWATQFYPTKAVVLNMNNFESLVLNTDNTEPWLIDFYSPHCGPCNIFMPKFEAIAEKLEGKVKCGKVNCVEQQYLCNRAGITAFPTIRFYPIPRSNSQWRSGDGIKQYEVNTVMREVNYKLKQYGYHQKKIQVKEEL